MHVGMLWFDNTPNVELKSKIEKAVDYYRRKYHQQPNLVLVHPSMSEGKDLPTIEGLHLRRYSPVLPGHIWVGIEDKPKKEG